MEESNKLALTNPTNLIVRVSTTVSITKKLIAENNRQLVLEIFEKNPEMFVTLISANYNLTNDLTIRYFKHLDWIAIAECNALSLDYISTFKEKLFSKIIRPYCVFEDLLEKNNNIEWSFDIIDEFKDLLNWDVLSYNKSLPWSNSLIERYKDYLNWKVLSSNSVIKWSESFIVNYQQYWNWEKLSTNTEIPWSEELIDSFITKWDWIELSKNPNLPWNQNFIHKYYQYWNWEKLSKNTSLPWSEELIDEFYTDWDWFHLSFNESLPLTIKMITTYKIFWDVDQLVMNKSFPLGERYLEMFYNEKSDFLYENFSFNVSKNCSIDIFEKNLRYINWAGLAYNQNITWSEELLDKYSDLCNWRILSRDYLNLLPWSLEFIEKYKNKLDWIHLSRNEKLPWCDELYKKYEELWDVEMLSHNNQFPWTLKIVRDNAELIEYFTYPIFWKLLKSHVDDNLIETVFDKIIVDGEIKYVDF